MLLQVLGPGIFALNVANAVNLENIPNDDTHQSITICHATHSLSNPYVSQSPNTQNDGSLAGGHLNHTGPVYPADNWGDIIPPYTDGNFNFPGLNWTTEGQAIHNNECKPAHIVVDVCSNIEGDQATLPDGYEFQHDGQCVLIPVDHAAPCIVPNTVVEGDKIALFGVTSPEITLQAALDAAYGVNAINNAVTAETGIQSWNIPVGTNSVTLSGKYVKAISVNTQVFGYYFDGNITTFTSIFDNTVLSTGSAFAPVTINTTGHTKIGFAIDTKPNSPAKYGTEKSVNTDSKDHAVVYVNPTNAKGYVIAFEDLPLTNVPTSSDADYQDMIVEVNVDSCSKGGIQCSPDSGTVSSNTTTQVTAIDGVATPVNTPSVLVTPTSVTTQYWTATVGDPLAKWIWSEDPVAGWTVDKTATFTKTFTISGIPNAGSMTIAGDNTYDITLNGHTVGQDLLGSMATFQTAQTYTIPASDFVSGLNTLEIKVKNIGLGGNTVEDRLNNPAGLLYTLSYSSHCGNGGGDNNPGTSKVHIQKFVDGKIASTVFTEQGSPSFPIVVDFGNSNVDTLLTSTNAYSWLSNPITNNLNTVTLSEKTGAQDVSNTVVDLPKNCTPGAFYLDGYTSADGSFDTNEAHIDHSGHLFFPGISHDKYVTIWNKSCPTSATIHATKIVCTTEADLPNWGNGSGPAIDANTASTFLASHPHCHPQPNWTFQWAPSVATNPGDNNVSAGSPWTNSGLTANDGTISINIPVSTNGGFVWMREVPQTGYIPFAGGSNQSNVSAEMYCNIDHLNYDNYDRVDGIVAGQTYDCVAWNVPTTPIDVCPNITGNQAALLVGYHFNADKQCIPNESGGGETGSLVVTVVVDNGVSATSKQISDFPLSVDSASVVSGATTNGLSAGTHAVTEATLLNYTAVFSGDCSVSGQVTVVATQTAHCTVTNTFHATPTIITECTSNCGGGGGGSNGGGGNGGGGGGGGASKSGGHRHAGTVAGASTDTPNTGEVLGATTDVPNLPNTGNGAHSQTLMITLALIASLFAINVVAIRKMKNS